MDALDLNEKRKSVCGDSSDEENGSPRKLIKLEGEYCSSSEACHNTDSDQSNSKATKPKSRFFQESEMQKMRIWFEPSSEHCTSFDNNVNPSTATKREKKKETQPLDVSELNEADLSPDVDEDYRQEFIKEEDVQWLNILRILEKQLIAREMNYKPIVATARNQWKQNKIMSMVDMLEDECCVKIDILYESNSEIDRLRDELVHRISEIRINSPEDVLFQDLLKELDDLELQKKALSCERRFFVLKWKAIQRIKNAKMFDSSFVAGELTRQAS